MVVERSRWMPDEQLVPAVLAGTSRRMSQLCSSDRSWVVAGLTLAGLTAEDIADRLSCSLRLVRSIRAEDMTQVCVHMQNETDNFTNELRLSRATNSAQTARITELLAEVERLRGKLSRVLDAHMGVKKCGRCDTPMAGYNVYTHDATGKDFCRECHRRRQQQYRDSRQFIAVLPGVVVLSQ